jgi:hypothetical protein
MTPVTFPRRKRKVMRKREQRESWAETALKIMPLTVGGHFSVPITSGDTYFRRLPTCRPNQANHRP